jgi:hypothetical protein
MSSVMNVIKCTCESQRTVLYLLKTEYKFPIASLSNTNSKLQDFLDESIAL